VIEQMHLLKSYVSHSSATRFFRDGEKYYIHSVYSLSTYPTVKEFSKLVNSWWSYRRNATARFWDTVYVQTDRI